MRQALRLLVFTTTLLFSITPLKATFFNNSLACFGPSIDKALTVVNCHDHALCAAAHKSSIILAKQEPPFRIRTIVVDAGHGGHDPGCLGAGSREKHLALAIAKAFAAQVNATYPDIQVILTRDKDVFIPLHERAAIANKANADLFISIHCNAMPPGNSGTSGTETYVMGLHTAEHNLDVAKRENAAILLEDDYERNYDYDPNSPEGHILLSMFQNAFLEQSILFAERVEHHFHTTAERKSRGVKQAGFVVLKETAMPSVLVETGFLTNRKDEAFLISEEGQQVVATALLNAFIEYKAMLEGESMENLPLASAPPPAATPVAVQKETLPSSTPPPSASPATVYQAKSVAVPPPSTPNYQAPAPPPAYNRPQVPDSQPKVVQAEPRIQPTPVQGTISSSTAPRGTAMQPRGTGDTSWAENIGQSTVEKKVEGLIYCVQLAASPKPLNTQATPWNQSDYLIEVLQEDEMYKYQVRNFPNFTGASNARYRVQQQGFPDAFVVAYYNGQRVSLDEARAMQR